MVNYQRWDIIYPSRYPESVKCTGCNNYFSIPSNQNCPSCNSIENVSNIIDKPRPCVLWIDKARWFDNMTFAIPLSSNPSRLYSNKFNVLVRTDQATFFKGKENYIKPFRAVIFQATRIDGSSFNEHKLIGRITNIFIQEEIEIKLIEWLFYNWT